MRYAPPLSRDDRVLETVFQHLMGKNKQYELYFLATGDPEQNVSQELLSKLWQKDKRIRNFSDCALGDKAVEKVTGKPGAVLVATIVRWSDQTTALIKGECVPSALSGGGFNAYAIQNADGGWTVKKINSWKF